MSRAVLRPVAGVEDDPARSKRIRRYNLTIQ